MGVFWSLCEDGRQSYNRKLFRIKFYESIIFYSYKTFLQRALGEHRCPGSASWRLYKVGDEPGVQFCTVASGDHQLHVTAEHLRLG